MSVCAEIIFSWLNKVLGIAKAQTSLGSLQAAVVLVAFVAGVCLVSILQASDWARVSTSAKLYFSTYITATEWEQDSIQHAVMGLSE